MCKGPGASSWMSLRRPSCPPLFLGCEGAEAILPQRNPREGKGDKIRRAVKTPTRQLVLVFIEQYGNIASFPAEVKFGLLRYCSAGTVPAGKL